jgi:hypothetical protein
VLSRFRRPIVWFPPLLLLAPLALLYALWQATRPSGRACFDSIQEGMTLEQVEAVLGPPCWEIKDLPEERSVCNWCAAEGDITIWFKDGLVLLKNYTLHFPEGPPQKSPLQKAKQFVRDFSSSVGPRGNPPREGPPPPS